MTARPGRRVLVSGMGGDLGSRVAAHLEREGWVGELLGIDTDPPRRRLKRAEFHLASPDDHDRILALVERFNPHVIVHMSVWEPFSRANPKTAKTLTSEAAISTLGAAAESRALESIVVRSGIEVYGRARGAPTRPDESAPIAPTCEFGRSLAEIEITARDIGRRIGVPVAAVRLGSVLGPHVPSPLGRLLRMPFVPFSVLADPPFAVVEDVECARAFVSATERRLDEPVNVLAHGAITVLQAVRRGGRIPVPLVGPDWRLAKVVSGVAGAPIPDHVVETLHRGRLADNGRMGELVGFTSAVTTGDVIDKLYAWPSVIRQPASRQVA
jgi:UDP-glucose 4-epimerase